MGNPKRRFSNSRTDKRRANWKLEAPALVKCPSCGEVKLMHNVCLNCGIYKGQQILKVEEAEQRIFFRAWRIKPCLFHNYFRHFKNAKTLEMPED